jgi:predicted helicase
MRTKLSDGADSYFRVDGADLGERNPKPINDDYVKFMRYAQYLIARTGFGVFGYITNHGFLKNPTFRGVRHSWLTTFDNIVIIDLHGDSKKKEKTPQGGIDENVFDITKGVAINISSVNGSSETKIFHGDVWGRKNNKYDILRGD